jgi:hypothetical protein
MIIAAVAFVEKLQSSCNDIVSRAVPTRCEPSGYKLFEVSASGFFA